MSRYVPKPTFSISLGLPNLGGWLAMLNCAACLAFVLAGKYGPDLPDGAEIVLGVVALFLTLPIALPFLIPRLDSDPSTAETILICVMVGINSFAWGYGLAAIYDWFCLRLLWLKAKLTRESTDR